MIEFKEFRLNTLFTSESGNFDIKKEHINGKGVNVITSGETDNGILGKTDIDAKIISFPSITVDMFGKAVYRNDPYKMVTHARVFALLPKFDMKDEVGIYLTVAINKITSKYSYNNMCSWNKINEQNILLPSNPTGEPDFDYMKHYISELEQERISELEQERISELDAYLKATGLEDYELTDEDKKILSQVKQIKFKELSLGLIFDIYSPKKRFNANSVKFGGEYPYVARTSSNNGIRGYITEDTSYLSPAKTLSFGQDTATVFYQPNAYFTGDKIKVMKLKNRELNDELAQYFITVISKAFSTFAWGQNSFNEKTLKTTKITLPLNSKNAIDFDYMERYIKVLEKIAIKDRVEHNNKIMQTTKEIINAQS